jgi:hypothetical protein
LGSIGGSSSGQVSWWWWLVGLSASVVEGVQLGENPISVGLAMAATAAIVDLPRGITACCCIPLAHVGGAVSGETSDPCDRTLAELDIGKRDKWKARCLR